MHVVASKTGGVVVLSLGGELLRRYPETSPKMQAPSAICTSQSGAEVYVCDTGNNRIVVFTPAGCILRIIQWMEEFPYMRLNRPRAIAYSCKDHVLYVADATCIHKFSLGGQHLSAMSSEDRFDGVDVRGPVGLAIAQNGNILCAQGTVVVEVKESPKESRYLRAIAPPGPTHNFTNVRLIATDNTANTESIIFVCDDTRLKIYMFQ